MSEVEKSIPFPQERIVRAPQKVSEEQLKSLGKFAKDALDEILITPGDPDRKQIDEVKNKMQNDIGILVRLARGIQERKGISNPTKDSKLDKEGLRRFVHDVAALESYLEMWDKLDKFAQRKLTEIADAGHVPEQEAVQEAKERILASHAKGAVYSGGGVSSPLIELAKSVREIMNVEQYVLRQRPPVAASIIATLELYLEQRGLRRLDEQSHGE